MDVEKDKSDGYLSETDGGNSKEPRDSSSPGGEGRAGGRECVGRGKQEKCGKETERKVGRGSRGPYKKSRAAETGSGNYYGQVQMRRQKVLSFLQKDVFQINRPDLRRFMNSNHAYECLLPYHIFYPRIYEDEMFVNTNDVDGMSEETVQTAGVLREAAELETRTGALGQTLICELLLYYQQKYINSVHGRSEEGTWREETGRHRRERQQLGRRNTVLRLRTARTVSGSGGSLRDGKLYLRKCGGTM